MITRQDDEETPLLQQPISRTPLPWDQFWIILFLQFPDSLVFQTLAPFTPQVSVFLYLDFKLSLITFRQADKRHRCDQRRRITGWTLRWHPGEHITILSYYAVLPDIGPSNRHITRLKH
jgi:hypothetical protein